MKKLSEDAEKIMTERFGKDTIIALATVENEAPFVRYVNAYYENGAFYIITYALSNKMKHMERNSTVAIAGEWFTAHGKSVNLGYFGKEENYRIAEKLKNVFSEWIDCYFHMEQGMIFSIQLPAFRTESQKNCRGEECAS